MLDKWILYKRGICVTTTFYGVLEVIERVC